MKAKQALAWIKKHGIAVESARASVPSLARAVAGEVIRGSWWGHPKGKEIFMISRAIRRSPDVVVCRLVDGKITYVHRRLWPALVRLAKRFPRARLGAVTEVHSSTGRHQVQVTKFPNWVPTQVLAAAKRLPEQAALSQLSVVASRTRLKDDHAA